MGSASILILFICGLCFALFAIASGKIFGPSSTNPEKGQVYECGIETKGVTWIQFNVGYYLFAIVYLIFDVEIVFLYPWASVMKEIGMPAFVEIVIFSIFLFMGLLYAYKKKALTWI